MRLGTRFYTPFRSALNHAALSHRYNKKEFTKKYTRGGAPLHELCSLSKFPIFYDSYLA